MPKSVYIEDLDHTLNFPDEATPEQIQDASRKFYEENHVSGLGESVVRGLKTGLEGIKQSVGGLLEAVPVTQQQEDTGFSLSGMGEEIYKKSEEKLSELQATQEKSRKTPITKTYEDEGFAGALRQVLDPGYLVEKTAAVVPSMAATVAAFAVGGPPGAALIGGGLEAGQEYHEVKEKTGDPDKALAAGGFTWLTSGVLNAIGMEKLLAPMAAKGAVSKAGSYLLRGGTESVTEFLESPASGVGEYLAGADPDWKQKFSEGVDALIPSFLAGVGTSVGGTHGDEFKTPKQKFDAQIKLAEQASAGIKSRIKAGALTTEQAIEELRSVQGISFTETEKEAFQLAAAEKKSTIESLTKKITARQAPVTLADVEWLSTLMELKDETAKKRTFSTATTVEQYLRDAGLKIEGDQYEPIIDDTLKAKIKHVYRGASDEELDLTAAIWEHMARQATRGLSYGPEVLINEALADVQPMETGTTEDLQKKNSLLLAAEEGEQRLKEIQAAIEEVVPGVKVVRGAPGQDISVSPDGKQIRVAENLLKKLKEAFPGREREALKAMVEEELIHQRHIEERGGEEKARESFIEEWDNATVEERQAVRLAYGNTENMHAAELGAELVRMKEQANKTGKITESIHPKRGKAAEAAVELFTGKKLEENELKQSMKAKEMLPHTVVRGLNRKGIADEYEKVLRAEHQKSPSTTDSKEFEDFIKQERNLIFSAGTDEEVHSVFLDLVPNEVAVGAGASGLFDKTFPTRVYHGTTFNPFESEKGSGLTVDPNLQNTAGGGDRWLSLWFTESPEEAEMYANLAGGGARAWGTNIRFHYLDIRNPFDMDNFAVHFQEEGFQERFVEALTAFATKHNKHIFGMELTGAPKNNPYHANFHLSIEDLTTGDDIKYAVAEVRDLASILAKEGVSQSRPSPIRKLLNQMAQVEAEAPTQFLEALGFDGAVHYTQQFGGSRQVKQWVVWNPSQIKNVPAVDLGLELTQQINMQAEFRKKQAQNSFYSSLKDRKAPALINEEVHSTIPKAKKSLENSFAEFLTHETEVFKDTDSRRVTVDSQRVEILRQIIDSYFPERQTAAGPIYDLPQEWIVDSEAYYKKAFVGVAKELKRYMDSVPLQNKTGDVIAGSIRAIDKAGKEIKFRTAASLKFPAVRYIIRGSEAADFSTAIHEFTHFLVLTADGDFKKMIEEKMGKAVPKWNRADHENFAMGFESWIVNGGEYTHSIQDSNLYSFLKRRLKETLENRMVKGMTAANWEKKPELENAFAYLLDSTKPEEIAANWTKAVLTGVKGVKVESMPRDNSEGLNQVLISKTAEFIPGNFEKWATDGLIGVERPRYIRELLGKVNKGMELTPSEMTAIGMADILTNYANADIAKQYITKSSIKAYEQMASALRGVTSGQGSKAGQMLASFRQLKQARDFISALAEAGKELDEKTLKMVLEAINSGDFTLLDAMQKSQTPWEKFTGVVQAIFYNSLLSSPRTWGVNGLSNATWSTYLIANQAIVAPVDKAMNALLPARFHRALIKMGFAPSQNLAVGEWTQMLRAAITPGVHYAGLVEAKRAFIDIRSVAGEHSLTKWEDEAAFLRSIIALEGSIGKIPVIGMAGVRAITAPTMFMASMDLYAKAVAEVMYDRAAFSRIETAKAKGGKEYNDFVLSFVKQNLSSLRVNKEVRKNMQIIQGGKLVKVPADGFDWTEVSDQDILNNSEMWLAAAQMNGRAIFAEHATFQDEAGAFTRRIAGGIRNLPFGIGRVFVPFAYTLANIAKRGAELTPGVGIAFGLKGKLSAAEVVAKQLEGGFIALLVWNLMEAGKLTGPPPDDPAERDAWRRQGKPAFSFMINGTWVDYRSFDPFGTALSLTTSAWVEWQREVEREQNPRVQQHTAIQKFNNVALATRDAFVTSSWLKGVAQFFGGDAYELESTENRMSTALIPYSAFWRSIHRSYEAYNTGEVAMKETSFASVLGDSVPGGDAFAMKLVEKGLIAPPSDRVDNMGKVISQKSTWWKEWLPIRYQTPNMEDPVEQELAEIELYPGMPGRVVTITKKRGRERMPDKYYQDYLLDYGPKAKERAHQLITSPSYMSQSREVKARMLEKVFDATRSKALERVKGQMRRDLLSGEWKAEPVLQNVMEAE